jgi:hypothetical protein
VHYQELQHTCGNDLKTAVTPDRATAAVFIAGAISRQNIEEEGMRPWKIAGLAMLALLPQTWITEASMLACQEPGEEHVPRDSWYRPMPIELIVEPKTKALVKWTAVDPADVHQVVKQKWSKAEAMLEKQWFYKLTADQAQEFTGKSGPKQSDKTPYLVPAIYYERGSGKFYVSTLGKYLSINHDSLGPWPAAMKRDALVVFLKTEPTLLFVTCGRTV